MAPNNLYFRLLWTLAPVWVLFVGPSLGQIVESNFTLDIQDIVAIRGEGLLINCTTPAGFLPTNVTWKKNSALLHYSSRVYTFSNGSLYFKRVIHRKKSGPSDEGQYTCVVENSRGVILARRTQVIIANVARQFSVQPQSLTAPLSATVYFHCAINALPQVIYTWERDGLVLPPQGHRHKTYNSGILEIVKVENADAGTYRCSARNSAGLRISREADLIIEDQTMLPPRLIYGPRNQTVVPGESVLLECHVLGQPRPKITWVNSDGMPVRGTRAGDSSLLIENIRVNEAGEYVCRVESDRLSQPVMSSAWLNVISPPTISERPAALVKNHQQMVELSCGVVGGNPEPTKTWLKDGDPVKLGTHIKIKNGKLTITDSSVDDSGYYQCLVENVAGAVSAFAAVLVKIAATAPLPPTNLRVQAISSSSVRLTWRPSVTPNIVAYSIHYFTTDGGEELQLQIVTQPDAVEEVIPQLLPHTSYTFYLMAFGGLSVSRQSDRVVYVTEDAVPTAAPEFSVTIQGSESIKVSWTELPPEQARGVIDHYRIYYRQHPGDSWENIPVSGDLREYIVTSLVPSTRYDIRVLAGTSKGVPEYLSDDKWPYKTVATLVSTPRKGPSTPEVQLIRLNSTAILVNWLSPPGDRIIGYKIYISRSARPMGNPRIELYPVNNITFTGLIPDTWYDIKVLAFNEKTGQEAFMTIKTLSVNSHPRGNSSVAPPMSLRAKAASNTTVTVTWMMPLAANISHFTIRYKPVHIEVDTNGSMGYSFLQCNQLMKTLTGLQPFTVYDIAVRSNQKNIFGPFGEDIQVRTLDGMPPAPSFLQNPSVGGDSIVLKWQPPRSPNGIIQSFLVLYTDNQLQIESAWRAKLVAGNVTQTTLEDLEPGTKYYIKMKTQNNAGFGEASMVLHVKTQPGYNILQSTPQSEPVDEGLSDQTMGIIIGVSIGLGCIIICVTVMLCWKRVIVCSPTSNNQYAHHNGNGHGQQGDRKLNGVGRRLSHPGSEMDSYMPIVKNCETTDFYLDTKGGNGKVHKVNGKNGHHKNGVKNGVKNGKLPNGHHRNGGEVIPRERTMVEDSVLHDYSFSYMGLPRADNTFESTLETTLDDIDRSYEEEDGEPTPRDELLPHEIPQRVSVHSADTGILQNSAGGAEARDPPQCNRSVGNDCNTESPPQLTTFKPANSVRITSNGNRPSLASETLSLTQVKMPPTYAGSTSICVT